jgi:hypothetical protein
MTIRLRKLQSCYSRNMHFMYTCKVYFHYTNRSNSCMAAQPLHSCKSMCVSWKQTTTKRQFIAYLFFLLRDGSSYRPTRLVVYINVHHEFTQLSKLFLQCHINKEKLYLLCLWLTILYWFANFPQPRIFSIFFSISFSPGGNFIEMGGGDGGEWRWSGGGGG